MAKDVTIFTTNTCSYCSMVKRYLDMKGQHYNVINLDEQPERREEALQISGAMTVPITVVTKQDDSQQVIVGYNLQQLAPALG